MLKYKLTEQQIDFISNDIRARGVTLVSLQHDLLDHVCCLVEQNLDPDGDFEAFYASQIKRFYKDRLDEIEHETIALLTFKHYYVMKKIMLSSGAASVAALTAGLFLKFGHMPGASLLICLGVFVLSFVFLPLLFVLRIREKSGARDKVIIGLGALAGILVSANVLLRIMHFAYANTIGTLALGIILLVFLPVYFFTGIRNPETKVNTAVSSIFIFYGCALVLMLVRSGSATETFQHLTADGIFRSEQILSEQQKQTALLIPETRSPMGGKDIFDGCETVKSFLLAQETGRGKIRSGEMLSEKDAHDYIGDNPEIGRKLDEIEQKAEAYNRSLASGQSKITSLSSIEKRKVADAINDLIQAQMVILQNQSAIALK